MSFNMSIRSLAVIFSESWPAFTSFSLASRLVAVLAVPTNMLVTMVRFDMDENMVFRRLARLSAGARQYKNTNAFWPTSAVKSETSPTKRTKTRQTRSNCSGKALAEMPLACKVLRSTASQIMPHRCSACFSAGVIFGASSSALLPSWPSASACSAAGLAISSSLNNNASALCEELAVEAGSRDADTMASPSAVRASSPGVWRPMAMSLWMHSSEPGPPHAAN
mmetsp:Transcript_67517/g.162041  ORF Transcript_67517/g.162041 Transcript_67517/m.162041 type:complete len:223 (-) Transcript_67517:2739-3407(-)